MRLWQRVAGALKDRNSILIAQLSRRSSLRNPHLESAVIKATSHDPHRIDGKNVQRVFQWLRTSPLCLRPLLWSLAMRMHRTRSWVVALKGLMLMHGIFCCDLTNVHSMGRLPFDFSDFGNNHADPGRVWAFDAFVRSYFAYLDQKSAFLASEFKKQNKRRKKAEETVMEELERLQAMQGLINMLLKIKPRNPNLHVSLVLEAMDCVVVELFDVYSKFCKGIARALLRIYEIGGKEEARVGIRVLQKAEMQCDELSVYFDFCREIGVLNASQCPKLESFPEGFYRVTRRKWKMQFFHIKAFKSPGPENIGR
ncbi:putative clathrin assembly protein [Senna tora]|uniref:Putative clathrin assembly protein n=1 Tax=Senna tora TaxID=362788 RepID=A0A834TG61_9FABA|nr:putative clathrin assembly protein [Senna tora]